MIVAIRSVRRVRTWDAREERGIGVGDSTFEVGSNNVEVRRIGFTGGAVLARSHHVH